MKRSLIAIAICVFYIASGSSLLGGSGTWLDTGSHTWNQGGNWSSGTIPNGTSDVATFAGSSLTAISVDNSVEVNQIVFSLNAASNPFTITTQWDQTLTISGVGITNNSGVNQSFVTSTSNPAVGGAGSVITFFGTATAGTNTVFTNDIATFNGVYSGPGQLYFNQNTTAASATIFNNGGSQDGGRTQFTGSATGASANITNYGASASGVYGGRTTFSDTSTAGSASISNDGTTLNGAAGGGLTLFENSATAGSANINNYGSSTAGGSSGATVFTDTATGGNANINDNGGGLSGQSGGMTIFSATDATHASTAGNAAINNNAGTVNGAGGGVLLFTGNGVFGQGAIAGNATINNLGATLSGALGGSTSFGDIPPNEFYDASSADHSTINNYGASVTSAGAGGITNFYNQTVAGSATINNKASSTAGALGGSTHFTDSANAQNANITNSSSTVANAGSGHTLFDSTSSAGAATITNNGSTVQNGQGGVTQFQNTATAGSATITTNGGVGLFSPGGETDFLNSSTAGSSTLIANGGTRHTITPGNGFGGQIIFGSSSSGGTSRVEVFGNGIVDISSHSAPGVTIGSLEGSGNVFLGSNNLTIGSNNNSTAFSGVIQNGASGGGGGTGGSLTKTGSGTLNLSGTNTYTGTTTVSGGILLVDGSIATSSAVMVNAAATLGGHGIVSTISGAGTVAPGDSPGILTATSVNPSGGTAFLFELAQAGSPTYSNAASSGNDVLHLTGATPLSAALTSANTITIDFTGASLSAGEIFRGGFFTDANIATSMVSAANFVYLGSNGFNINFDGFVTEMSADFAGGTVLNGRILQFDIENPVGGGSVPDSGKTVSLLGIALAGIGFVKRKVSGRT